MNINRHNYEECFLLYVDNELSAHDRRQVELFVQGNPDLEEELIMLQQTVLRPDKKMVFENKRHLLKNPAMSSGINENNYEEFFVLYGDDELDNEGKSQVEEFVYKHPQYQVEFELIQQARFMPDAFTVFPDKQVLYRHEEPVERVVTIRWYRIAAAAAVLLFIGGLGWYSFIYNKNGSGQSTGSIASEKTINSKETVVDKKDTPAVTNNDIAAGQNVEGSEQDQVKENKQLPVIQQASTNKNQVAQKQDKKNSSFGNIQDEPNVSPKESIAKLEPGKEGDAGIGTVKATEDAKAIVLIEPKPIVDVAVGSEKTNEDVFAYAANAESDRIDILNTSVSKKNSMRGFFRKVSRVVGKASGLGPNENDNSRGIRIANFEIALK